MAQNFVEQEKDQLTHQLIKSVFAEPSPYKDAFQERGLKIGSDESVGVGSTKIFQRELQLMGLSGKYARNLARYLEGRLHKQDVKGVFPITTGLTIIGEKKFFRRSDLSVERASERHIIYEEVLAEKLAEKKEKEEEQKAAELNKPSSANLTFIGTYNKERFLQKVQQNSTELEADVKSQPIIVDQADIPTIEAVMDRRDIRLIVENGLSPDQLADIIIRVRRSVITQADTLETQAKSVAEFVHNQILDKMQQAGKKFNFPIYASRDLISLIGAAFEDLTEIPNLDYLYDIEEIKPRVGLTSPFPRLLLSIWGNRFTPKTLQSQLSDIELVNPKMGQVIRTLLLSDKKDQQLIDLKRNGQIIVDEQYKLDKNELQQILEPLLFSDELLTKAIFADFIGDIYGAPYLLSSRAKELALFSLRSLAYHCTLEDIQKALLPQENPQKTKLDNQLAALNEQLEQVKGKDKNSGQRRQALAKQTDQLTKKIKGLSTKTNITTAVKDLLFSLVPRVEPKPENYPNKDESAEYNRDFHLYQAHRAITPEGWHKNWKYAGEPMITQMNLKQRKTNSLIPRELLIFRL